MWGSFEREGLCHSALTFELVIIVADSDTLGFSCPDRKCFESHCQYIHKMENSQAITVVQQVKPLFSIPASSIDNGSSRDQLPATVLV